MKRDMDLIRLLLIQVEEGNSTSLEGYTKKQILYHKNLLIEAGLVHGAASHGDDQLLAVWINDLTWEGHEFLDVVRDADIWQRTKDKVGKNLSGTSIVIIKELAISLARNIINTGTYVDGNVNTGEDFVGRDHSEASNNQN